ncbi:MAG: AMP-binding protein, partial [candidate division NC10 bacterium]
PVVVGAGGPLSWRALRERVTRLAGGLAARGVGRGDRVAILAQNDARYFETYLALAWLGALAVPLNTRLAPAELAFQLADAEARLWLVGDSLAALADAVTPQPARLALGDPSLLAGAPVGAFAAVAPEDTLGIFYTGGTTGLPKGVMLTHGNVLANSRHVMRAIGYSAEDLHLHAAPIFHLADLGHLWAVALAGGAHAFVPSYSPETFCEAMERTRATVGVLAPAMVTALVRFADLGKYDLSRWRVLIYGGSPITEETLRRALALLPCRLWQGYGQTEATHTVCFMTPEMHDLALARPALARSCGRPIAGVEVRVAGGEIVVRGPTVMKGYWKRPAETAEALAGGWLHTGDVATVDADGFIYILDRKKDMIITGGENVYSVEVENALASYPAVADAGVIGVPDETWGERVHAVVVLRPGARATAEELQQHCRTLIGGYKVPKTFEFAETLPRTPSGKIQKAALREPYWRGEPREVS